MKYYLATGRTSRHVYMQICVEVDPNDPKFVAPLECCTNAESQIFWRNHLKTFGVDQMSSIKPINGFRPL